MDISTKELGMRGEIVAQRFIERQGYLIEACNYRCRCGEIDIIARDKDTLVMIEVKTRRSGRCGSPWEAVHLDKQHKIRMVAQHFLQQYRGHYESIRFDVIAIWVHPDITYHLYHEKECF